MQDFIYYHQRLASEFTSILLYVISDIHYGDPFCSFKHVERLLSHIQETPNAFIILAGDLIDCRLKASPGNIYDVKLNPQEQRDFIIEKFMPLKDRVLGMTQGNHEDRINKEAGIDVSQDIAKALNCPYDPDGILLKVSFGSGNKGTKDRPYVFYIYSTHGYGNARTSGAQINKLERQAEILHTDVLTMSHDHTTLAEPIYYLMPDARTLLDKSTGFEIGKVKAHTKLLVKTGAFLKFGGYGRAKGWRPRPLTTPRIELTSENARPQVHVTI